MSIQTTVCQHLRRSGFSKTDSARLASQVSTWVDKSGAEWAAQRLKDLEQYSRQLILNPGSKVTPPSGWALRTNRHGRKILRDGFLHREIERSSFDQNQLWRVEQIMKIRSVILNPTPSIKQQNKVLRSIEAPFTGISQEIASEYVHQFVHNLIEPTVPVGTFFQTPKQVWMCDDRHLSSYFLDLRSKAPPIFELVGPHKTSPFYRKVKGKVVMVKPTHRLNLEVVQPNLFVFDRRVREYLDESDMHQVIGTWLGSQRYHGMEWPEPEAYNLPVGVLSALDKDGSAKTRIIASPCYDLQSALKPLQIVLDHLVKLQTSEAVHDQDNGRETVSAWLRDGRKVYSFDASSFTDRFPWKLQRQLLCELAKEGLGVTNTDIKLMDYAVSGLWKRPSKFDESLPQFYHYEVGQPMGLNPSFALASLSHLMVAYQSCVMVGRPAAYALVRIVGDDIVIADEPVAIQYNKLIADHYGVTVNDQKTMKSSKVAQFCGKLITPDGVVSTVKVRPNRSISAVAEKIKHYGVEMLHLFHDDLVNSHNIPIMPGPYGLNIKPKEVSYTNWINSVNTDWGRLMTLHRDLTEQVGAPLIDQRLYERQAAFRKRFNIVHEQFDDLSEMSTKQDIGYDDYTSPAAYRDMEFFEDDLRSTETFLESPKDPTLRRVYGLPPKERGNIPTYSDVVAKAAQLGGVLSQDDLDKLKPDDPRRGYTNKYTPDPARDPECKLNNKPALRYLEEGELYPDVAQFLSKDGYPINKGESFPTNDSYESDDDAQAAFNNKRYNECLDRVYNHLHSELADTYKVKPYLIETALSHIIELKEVQNAIELNYRGFLKESYRLIDESINNFSKEEGKAFFQGQKDQRLEGRSSELSSESPHRKGRGR